MTTQPEAAPVPRYLALPSRWRPLHEALRRIDAEIAEVYARLGASDVRPRYSMALMFLADGPATIRQLAFDCGVTHSAMSQSVASMRDAGLVASEPDPDDARSRRVTLTAKGAAIVPLLTAEWDATEAALAALDAEVPYPLATLADDLRASLDRARFADRVMDVIDLPGGLSLPA